jgi:hypothetical protein
LKTVCEAIDDSVGKVRHVVSMMRSIQPRSARPQPAMKRLSIASARALPCGGTHQ